MENFDYEKAYKAVLQTATQWIKDGCTDKERICLECVFPELRESEDERIRKKLIGIFTNQSLCDVYNLKSEDVLAYLEKQKEHKHAPDDLQKSFEAGQTSIVDNPEQYGLCKKPAWSDEDEKHFNNILDIINYWKATARFVSYQDGTAVDRDINWLKSLLNSWKPTEEQMKGLKFFLDFHRPQRNAGTTCWREYDAVELLYKQLQKL